jgi:hypothetical protein
MQVYFKFKIIKKTARTGCVGPLDASARRAGRRKLCPTLEQTDQNGPFTEAKLEQKIIGFNTY